MGLINYNQSNSKALRHNPATSETSFPIELLNTLCSEETAHVDTIVVNLLDPS